MPAADKPSYEELAALVVELSARLERAEARIAELEAQLGKNWFAEPTFALGFDSSVLSLVDLSWRWYWVVPEMRRLEFDIHQYDLLDAFLEYAISVDVEVGSRSEETSLRKGLISGW
ncbi:hypothetical protein GCM10023196_034920 [Actinoallomurus vinaceus]|uniref:Uncharacterized protein n=1 Tax=Actinoallomurus vinaceus TaxID=1080074 RepID=A0ABP8U8N0_9ACTN